MAKKKTKTKSDDLPFEESLERLETIVRQLESGEMGLNDALQQYEDGIRYLKQCHQALRLAETKIEMLTRIDRDGNSDSVPFDDETEESLEQKKSRRSDRRSGPADPNSDSRELF